MIQSGITNENSWITLTVHSECRLECICNEGQEKSITELLLTAAAAAYLASGDTLTTRIAAWIGRRNLMI